MQHVDGFRLFQFSGDALCTVTTDEFQRAVVALEITWMLATHFFILIAIIVFVFFFVFLFDFIVVEERIGDGIDGDGAGRRGESVVSTSRAVCEG